MNSELMAYFEEMYKEFCRLKGYKDPTTPIEKMTDKATEIEEAHMKEFSQWVETEILVRLNHTKNK